jgi:PTS system galactitol-specific IIA component
MGLFRSGLCVARLTATNAEEAIRKLARVLAAAGHVKPSFEAAAVAREKRSPTGLPFPEPVALPHAEPEHVVSAACAIAVLATPVKFHEMGSPGALLEARIVVMPALTAKEQAAAGLSELIELLQDDARRAAILRASSAEEIARAVGAIE